MNTIYLDDTPLPGFDHRLTVLDQIESGDLSGETSSTARSHKGWKPAVLTVSLKIRMSDPGQLAELRRLWHQVDLESGGNSLLAGTLKTASGAPGPELSFCAGVCWVGPEGTLATLKGTLGV